MTAKLHRLAIVSTFAFLPACGAAEVSTDETDVEEVDSFDDVYMDGKEDSATVGRFDVFTGTDGRYYFHLLASNGQQVLHSQSYSSSSAATGGIASVRSNVADNARVEARQSSDSQWYFVVKGGNGQVVAVSELYVSRSNADRALAAVRTTVRNATTRTARTVTAAFQVFKGLDGKYYFHVRARNGEILVQSEAYDRRAAAVSGTASVAENGPVAARYQVRSSTDGQAYFVLRAVNNNVVAKSQIYASNSVAGRAREAFLALMAGGGVARAR